MRLSPRSVSVALGALLLTTGLRAAEAQEKFPDLSGVYGRDVHGYPKPYLAGRAAPGTPQALVTGGYNNEYLKPWVIELLERDELVTTSGRTVVTAHSACYPEGIPYAYGASVVHILQRPNEITLIYADHNQWRTIYMNVQHPTNIKPSWWGDSVGHFEGDTLVIDTVGIAVNPQSGSMGRYGTPHSEALHVVERIRFLRPGEASNAPAPRDDTFAKEDVVEGGKVLRLSFTVEDPIAYKKPWTTTLDYLSLKPPIKEYSCAENSRFWDLSPMLPTAAVPDF